MKRVLAAAAALAMIGLSLFIRGRVDDDGGGGDAVDRPSGSAVLVCVTELKDVCEGLEGVTVRIEDAGSTAADIAAGEEAAFSAWLAPAPWAGIVEARAEGALGQPSRVLARSPVVIAMWNDRLTAIEATCGGTVTFACLADASGKPWTAVGGEASWGNVKVGLPIPDTADGLLVLGAVGSSLADRPDFASNDFDDAFAARLKRIGALSKARDPLTDMVRAGRSLYGAAGAVEHEAGPLTATTARAADVRLIYPSPMVTSDLVLIPVQGDDRLERLATDSELAAALAKAGWRVGGQPSVKGLSAARLPSGSGLPDPGVLSALQKKLAEVTG
jgi:hypothetical protein